MAEIVAETARLRLRDWDDGDEARFYAIMNTPAVMQHLGGVQTQAEWGAAYHRLLTYQSAHGHTFWLVERKEDGELVGFCGLKRANAPGAGFIGAFEIGWRLREGAWGQGYAKESAIAVLDLAFSRFAAPFVVAPTAPGNLASQALMKRLGMSRAEDLDFVDERFPADSAINPQIVHRISAAEWPAARAAALA